MVFCRSGSNGTKSICCWTGCCTTTGSVFKVTCNVSFKNLILWSLSVRTQNSPQRCAKRSPLHPTLPIRIPHQGYGSDVRFELRLKIRGRRWKTDCKFNLWRTRPGSDPSDERRSGTGSRPVFSHTIWSVEFIQWEQNVIRLEILFVWVGSPSGIINDTRFEPNFTGRWP